MAAESSPLVPVSEAQGRAPVHLRYFSLLRSNPRFRRLWLAQLISEIGDWFYSLAVYDLLLVLTNSGKVVAWSIIIQTLPWFLMTPLAGHIADRFSRRRLMIVADVARGFVVLGLLLVRTRSDVWLAYALLFAEVIFAAVFEPARNALLPNLTRDEELLPANALSTVTWSFALTIGAGLGGAAVALFGREVAFIMNSLSFFASALLIARIAVREAHIDAKQPADANRASQGGSLAEGAAYLRDNPKISVLVLAKLGLGCMGGMLALLVVFGERIFPIAGKGALAMGLLYAARGVGAGIWAVLRRSSGARPPASHVEAHRLGIPGDGRVVLRLQPRAVARTGACRAVLRPPWLFQCLGDVHHASATQRQRPLSRPRLCARFRPAHAFHFAFQFSGRQRAR